MSNAVASSLLHVDGSQTRNCILEGRYVCTELKMQTEIQIFEG